MKRGFPQTVRPSFPQVAGHDALEALRELEIDVSRRERTSDVLQRVRQIRAEAWETVSQDSSIPNAGAQGVIGAVASMPETSSRRRVRTSAAVMGLALSVGASDILSLVATARIATAETVDPISAHHAAGDGTADTADLAKGEALKLSWPDSTVLPEGQKSPAFSSAAGNHSAAATPLTYHLVRSGESLAQIAQIYRVSATDLIQLNRLESSGEIRAGQTIKVPLVSDVGSARTSDVASQSALARLRTQQNQLKRALGSLGQEDGQAPASPVSAIPYPIDSNSDPSNPETHLQSGLEQVELSDLAPYRVQPGDTLDSIARSYAISRQDLISLNQLGNPNVLKVDQVLGIPRAKMQQKLVAKPAAGPSSGSVAVVPSNSKPDSIEVQVIPPQVTNSAAGDRVESPSPLQSPPVVSAPMVAAPAIAVTAPVLAPELDPALRPAVSHTYSVELGDTLASIARKYGVSANALAQLNQLTNPDYIYVGQALSIPVTDVSRPSAGERPSSEQTSGEQIVLEPLDNTVASAAELNVPTVPSLHPLTQPNGSVPATAPIEAPVVSSQPVGSSPVVGERSPRSYVEGLLSEVEQLRKQRQQVGSQAIAVVPAPSTLAAAPLPTSQVVNSQSLRAQSPSIPIAIAPPANQRVERTEDRVNPEFRSRYLGEVQQQFRQAAPKPLNQGTPRSSSQGSMALQVTPPTRTTAPVAERTLVAAAPLGSQTYEPLVQSLLGRTVSPDLPPLSSDPFLPDGVLNGYVWPAQGVLSSGYGWRWGRMHKGIDIAGPVGTPIVAAAGGVVTYAGWNDGGYGNLVEITHPDGSVTLYAHNNRISVRNGQRVRQGEQIAEMGNTGFSTGPHLHFELHPAGKGATNPMAYLPKR